MARESLRWFLQSVYRSKKLNCFYIASCGIYTVWLLVYVSYYPDQCGAYLVRVISLVGESNKSLTSGGCKPLHSYDWLVKTASHIAPVANKVYVLRTANSTSLRITSQQRLQSKIARQYLNRWHVIYNLSTGPKNLIVFVLLAVEFIQCGWFPSTSTEICGRCQQHHP